MSLIVIFALALLSSFAWFFKFHRTGFLLLVVTFGLFEAIGAGYLPRVGLREFQTRGKLVDPAWGARNAIVVLGAGTVAWRGSEDVGAVTATAPLRQVSTAAFGQSRLVEAARLLVSCKKTGKVCKLFLSGGDPSKNGITEAEVMQSELVAAGLDPADMILETESRSTFHNALYVSKILRAADYDRMVLVSSGFHLDRALTFFKHFIGDFVPAPSDQWSATVTFLPLSFNFVLFDIVAHETMGLLQYRVYNWMGWNPPPVN